MSCRTRRQWCTVAIEVECVPLRARSAAVDGEEPLRRSELADPDSQSSESDSDDDVDAQQKMVSHPLNTYHHMIYVFNPLRAIGS